MNFHLDCDSSFTIDMVKKALMRQIYLVSGKNTQDFVVPSSTRRTTCCIHPTYYMFENAFTCLVCAYSGRMLNS